MQVYLRNIDGLFMKAECGIDEDGQITTCIIPMKGIILNRELYTKTLNQVIRDVCGDKEPDMSNLTETSYKLNLEINKKFRELYNEGLIRVFDTSNDEAVEHWGKYITLFTTDGLVTGNPYSIVKNSNLPSALSIH